MIGLDTPKRITRHCGQQHMVDQCDQTLYWMGLAVVLLIAAIERWIRPKGDDARGLLTEAIVLAAIREGGINDTRTPGAVI